MRIPRIWGRQITLTQDKIDSFQVTLYLAIRAPVIPVSSSMRYLNQDLGRGIGRGSSRCLSYMLPGCIEYQLARSVQGFKRQPSLRFVHKQYNENQYDSSINGSNTVAPTPATYQNDEENRSKPVHLKFSKPYFARAAKNPNANGERNGEIMNPIVQRLSYQKCNAISGRNDVVPLYTPFLLEDGKDKCPWRYISPIRMVLNAMHIDSFVVEVRTVTCGQVLTPSR